MSISFTPGTYRPARRDPDADRAALGAIQAAAQAGDMEKAASMAQQALKGGLEHPMLLNLAALKLENEGRLEEALACLRRALELSPGAVAVLIPLGLCLQRMERFVEALQQFEAALAADPGFAPAHHNRASVLEALGDLAGAEAGYRKALDLQPGHLAATSGLASIAGRRGDNSEARRLAEQVLAAAPNHPDSTMTLAAADLSEGAAHQAETRLRAFLADPRLSLLERALAMSLLGDVLDALDQVEPAFEAYASANGELLRVYGARFGPARASGESALDVARWLADHFEQAGSWARAASEPLGANPDGAAAHVFLLGFPRSGTTLLEQVLASHPDVETLSEQEALQDTVREYLRRPADLDRFAAAGEAELEPLRAAYWRSAGEAGARPAGKVFVDKHPLNTLKLPAIARLFPGAKVLLARRDPRDVILSCYRRRFRMSAPTYQLLSLDTAAALYAQSMRLAAGLEGTFGLSTLVVRHEALVADFEAEIRAVCDFLGLVWTEAMGDFAGRIRERAVATPSGAQLSRGLNAEGVGQWRRYRAHLQPVLPVLAPWVERFGYEAD